jgi:hypothetical protein
MIAGSVKISLVAAATFVGDHKILNAVVGIAGPGEKMIDLPAMRFRDAVIAVKASPMLSPECVTCAKTSGGSLVSY